MPQIIQDWIAQLCEPDTVQMVKMFGAKRRIDLTLFSDRARVSIPPAWRVT